MADIEPELTYENIAGLDEQYAALSPEQKMQRVRRYAASVERCFALMDLVLSLQKGDMTRFRTHVMHRLKQQADAEDTNAMATLEQSLNDA